MGVNVHLTPEFERFARQCVAEGRHNNVSEVVRQGLRMLQDAEDRKRRFMAMVREVQADVAQNGTVSLEDAMAEIDRIIDETEQLQKAKS